MAKMETSSRTVPLRILLPRKRSWLHGAMFGLSCLPGNALVTVTWSSLLKKAASSCQSSFFACFEYQKSTKNDNHPILHIEECIQLQWRCLNHHGWQERMDFVMQWLTWATSVPKLPWKLCFPPTITLSKITLHNSLSYERVSVYCDLSYSALKNEI